jgi:Flp pilus assembly protein TadG
MRTHRDSERGTILIAMAMLLALLVVFLVLASEAGRWYLVRAELAKSVDAAALGGTRVLGNPYIDANQLAREYGMENFPTGAYGTPPKGGWSVFYDAQNVRHSAVKVTGRAEALGGIAEVYGLKPVRIRINAEAEKRQVEIALLLDRSASMSGARLSALKSGARSFLTYFESSQSSDKLGLVSFGTSARLDRPVSTGFVTATRTAIDGLTAAGACNAEQALALAAGAGGLTDQSEFPDAKKVAQFAVFFTDSRPTAFRDAFLRQGTTLDAVGCVTGDCLPGGIGGVTVPWDDLGRPDQEQWLGVDPRITGDGLSPASSACTGLTTTRWYAFDSSPVPGYAPTACDIPQDALASHVCSIAAQRALARAAVLKQRGVTVIVIGLGTGDEDFLAGIASARHLVYTTDDAADLPSLFQQVAQQVQLLLVR